MKDIEEKNKEKYNIKDISKTIIKITVCAFD